MLPRGWRRSLRRPSVPPSSASSRPDVDVEAEALSLEENSLATLDARSLLDTGQRSEVSSGFSEPRRTSGVANENRRSESGEASSSGDDDERALSPSSSSPGSFSSKK